MFRRKLTYIITAVLLSAGLFAGCVRDDVDIPSGGEQPEIGADEYAMAIDFNLGTYPSEYQTRSGLPLLGNITRVNFHPDDSDFDYWESYIDLYEEMKTYSNDSYRLYILLFDEDNNFMFNPCGVDKETGRMTNMFQVSSTGITDNNEFLRWRAVFQAPTSVRDYIKTHKFKVAVFANWPVNNVKNEMTGGEDRIMPEEFTNNLPWGGRNPDLKPGDANYDTEGPISIRKLARSVYDKTYGGQYYDVYYFLTEYTELGAKGGRMGPFTDWVFNYHENQDNAVLFTRGFINDRLGHNRAYYENRLAVTKEGERRSVTPRVFRRNFDDEFKSDDRIFIYQNLWKLWNFGGLYNARVADGNNYRQAQPADENTSLATDGKSWSAAQLGNPSFTLPSTEYANVTDSKGVDLMYYGRSEYVSVWASRNHRRARKTFQEVNGADLIESVYNSGVETDITDKDGNSTFLFISTDDADVILDHNSKSVEPTYENGALKYTGSDKAKLGKDDKGYIYLRLPSGGSKNKNVISFKVFADAVLYIKYTGNITVESDSYHFDINNEPGSDNYEEGGWFLDIPTDPSEVWIYSSDGTGQIYEIEMIQKKYLYDSDRRTLLPSSHQLIPMYGIQEFEPLGDYWVPGQIFDLSHDNGQNIPGYNYKPIYLLRSVARVEVLVSKQFSEIYKEAYIPRLIMRSMNRTARCMPLDVITPTEEIWADVDQEILNIREHGPFFTTEFGDNTAAEQEEFRNRLAWFYSKWVYMWNWDWNGWYPSTMNTSLTPPAVFNSKIDRTDYVRMIKVDDNYEGYERYILYMPDKAIDDADDAGDLSATPKVPHLEIRIKGEPVDNLDDNHHERIYFMDYASTGGPNITTTDSNGNKTYDAYEKDREHLKNHWPVMRNHIYRFRVHPSGNENVSVTLQVAGAASREVTIPPFN